MSLEITWLGHASFRISDGEYVIYIDPWKLTDTEPAADAIFVSHEHYDHFSMEDIKKISKDSTRIFAPSALADQIPGATGVAPGQTAQIDKTRLEFTASYNVNKYFHPKEDLWVGVVVEILGKRVYYAGDTDLIPEMSELRDIDLALLPVGGTYTLDAIEAAQACKIIKPKLAMPYHFGDIVGAVNDAELFAQNAPCKVAVLKPGEKFLLD